MAPARWHRICRLSLCLLLLAPASAAAQSLPASPASSTEKPGKEETAPAKDEMGLIVTASSRGRYESVAGRPRPGYATSEDAFELRTGVAVEYGPGPLAIGAELIDSRAYGLVPTSQIGRDDVDAVELPQAYLKLKLDGVRSVGRVGAQAGRFLLNFGASRLVGTDEYRNTVNGFTGLRVDLGDPDKHVGQATLFYVLPQERLPDDEPAIRRNKVVIDRETFADVLFGAKWRRAHLAGGELELLWLRLVERDTPGRATADRHLHTLDARLSREAKARTWDYDGEGAYQFGRASSSTTAGAPDAPVSAGFAHASVGYTFGGPLKPRLGAFYDFASGDRPGGRFGRFDTLFGSRRDDLGPSGTYAALARENISAPGIRLEAKPGARFEFLSDWRAVWLASRYDRFYNVTDATGRSGDLGGQQIEGRVRYWLIPKRLRLESNYAVLFKGGFLRNAPQALDRSDPTVRLFEVNLQATF